MSSVRRPASAALHALLAAALLPAAATAQATVNADVATANAYVWRGLTFTNRPVLQPDAYVTAPAGHGSVVAGVALNVEPAAYNGPRDQSVLGAESGTLVTASTLWSEYTRPAGPVSATMGVIGYVYPRANGIADAYNTAEVYARVAAGGPLAPAVAVYYDVLQVRGAYVEASLRHTVPAGAHVSLAFGAAAGASAGQGPEASGRQTAYFAGNGLTHVDLSAAATWTAGGLSVTPSVHGLLLRDAATRLTAPNELRAARLNLGVSLGWARAVRRARPAAIAKA
jgi:hypothetical protein